ncbi:hypothetical protein [Microbacterium deminutum]|uniref:Uncharacterized protein n=1 Tax=Microbacterium deminutum TaxID=344164 RepID=A0ABN2QUN1_9MICO
MHDALAALARAAATPTPTPSGVDPTLVTPGPWGFVVVVFIALAVIFLVWDMMRRIRRGRVRADIIEELDAEEQAAAAMEATDVDDQRTDAAGDDDASPGRRD